MRGSVAGYFVIWSFPKMDRLEVRSDSGVS